MTDFAKLVLSTDTTGLKRGERDLGGMARTATSTAGRVDGSNAKMSKSFGSLARVGILPVITAFGGAILSVNSLISVNASFGASMQKVAAISGATGVELEQLRQTAKDLGASTEFSASQAADAMGFLAMAGFTAAESMEAIPSVLALATAGSLELASAADIASNVLSGFGMNAAEAGRVSDVLASAASSTNTSVSQLGQAMSTAAPIAAALGITMESTAASIGVMSDAGIQGERAGTALRGVLASLSGPTSQAQDALAKYGLTAADVSLESNDLADVLDTLKAAELSTADAMTIFGREAASGALVMVEAAGRARELAEEFGNADGAAQGMADTMADNLNGDLKALKSSLEGLIIELGDGGASGAFRSLAQLATEALRSITENLNTLMTVVGSAVVGFASYKAVIIATTAASTLMAGRFGIMAGALASVTTQVGLAAAAKIALQGASLGAAAAARTLTAALLANPVTAIAVGIGTITAAIYGLRDSQVAARTETNNLITSLKSLAQARSADFAGKRLEIQMQRNKVFDRIGTLENLGDIGLVGKMVRMRLGGSADPKKELRDLRWELVQLDGALAGADATYKRAAKAAESMNPPVARTSSSVAKVTGGAGRASRALGGLSTSMNTANGDAKALRDSIQSLYDRLFPERAAFTRYREMLDLIRKAREMGASKGGFDADTGNKAEARSLNQYLNSQFGKIKVTALSNAQLEKIPDSLKKITPVVKQQTVRIAESFKDMADKALSALDRMVGAIKGGGFFDILSSVIGLGLQLGSAGVFGKGIQTSLNSAPSFAGGGYTGSGARSGGLDGKGGFMAMLHPQETVTDHTKAGNGSTTHITFGVEPSSGNIIPFIDGRIQTAAPAIANDGAQLAVSRSARAQSRRTR